jgi:hypothetical protein
LKRYLHESFAALALSALLIMMGPASGHEQEKTDPNDATGPLDLSSATFAHPLGDVKSTLTTRGDWGAGALDDGSALAFDYDSRGNAFGDFYVRVKAAPDGGLRGRLFEGGNGAEGGGQLVSRVDARRDGRTLIVRFPMHRLDPRPGFIGWSASTLYKGSPSCTGDLGCFDIMPDGTFYSHNL